MEIIEVSTVFGFMLTILAYMVGEFMRKKAKSDICSPFLIAVIVIIAVLLTFDIDYEIYQKSASYLSYLLTPATICLAISLYEQIQLLKNNIKAILIAITAGAFTSMMCIFVFSKLFSLDYYEYVTLLPKSITTAIAMGVIDEFGGYVTITIVAVILTGILGNSLAVAICKYAKIKHPISKGLAIGTASHAIGTAKAIEMGDVEGAMSGLAIVVTGTITVVFMSFFTMIY